ncbi:MAG: hypothetical protein KME26_04455 [Oscillatoria princeps RMCB-10]|nr:hypothetical protein [Oscillatoria princeps RMCB-10]
MLTTSQLHPRIIRRVQSEAVGKTAFRANICSAGGKYQSIPHQALNSSQVAVTTSYPAWRNKAAMPA